MRHWTHSTLLRCKISGFFSILLESRGKKRYLSTSSRFLGRGFQFESGLVLFEEGTEAVGGIEKAHPLLVVECDGEAPETIDADAAFFADAKFQGAAALRA